VTSTLAVPAPSRSGLRSTEPCLSELCFTEVGLSPDLVGYQAGWDAQRALHTDRVAGLVPDTVLLLEHESVYTAGRRTQPEDLPTDGSPVIEVDRGGRITWHGPGQLVGYPVIALAEPVDVVSHVRRLEAALMAVCGRFGVGTTRVDGRSGVWVTTPGSADRKIAAIGIRVARGVTMHGFALNCDCDLTAFTRIVPCGLPDAGVTSLTEQAGRHIGVRDVLDAVRSELAAVLAPAAGVAEEVVA
jgi:lipoyl(octanoyl) transferase